MEPLIGLPSSPAQPLSQASGQEKFSPWEGTCQGPCVRLHVTEHPADLCWCCKGTESRMAW